MGCATSTPYEEAPTLDVDLNDLEENETITRDKGKNFMSTHSKQNERYFNRQFKVSVCSAQGERRSMEDDHLCQFILSKHPNYSLFAIFDGHNGSDASIYLAEHLYKVLNNLPDLENNDDIISAIKKMDKRYLSTTDYIAGSTVVFVIICSELDAVVNMKTSRTLRMPVTSDQLAIDDDIKSDDDMKSDNDMKSDDDMKTDDDMGTDDDMETDDDMNNDDDMKSLKAINSGNKPPPLRSAKKKVTKSKKKLMPYGASAKLPGFAMKYGARVFWCGDSRGYLLHGSGNEDNLKYDALTLDHDTKNEMEVKRIKAMNGKIIGGRVDGKLAVTRSFGDSRMKYKGSVIIPECEYKEFEVNVGDSLLLCCDGLVEKWSDRMLMQRLVSYLDYAHKDDIDTDTVKVIGDLVDDAIHEGSTDNISAMLIQFKDGTKQKSHAKYHNVKSA